MKAIVVLSLLALVACDGLPPSRAEYTALAEKVKELEARHREADAQPSAGRWHIQQVNYFGLLLYDSVTGETWKYCETTNGPAAVRWCEIPRDKGWIFPTAPAKAAK